MMKTVYIAIPLLAALTLAGCKQNTPEAATPDTTATVAETSATVGDSAPAAVELVPVIRTAKPSTASSSISSNSSNSNSSSSSTSSSMGAQTPLKGTIYVETDGAQGRVWGHVTMNGDRGTGTIHDWDENTWAVSVTRHGDELFAVDQNSRLYVFKLKK